MTVKINADTSDGLKFVSDTSGTVDIQSNGTTKMSVTSSDITAPAGVNIKVHGSDTAGTQAGLWLRDLPRVTNDTSTFEHTYINSNNSLIFTKGSSATTSSNTEYMRLDSSGNLLFGTTTYNGDAQNLATGSIVLEPNGQVLVHSTDQPLELARTAGDTNSRAQIQFFREGSIVGTITTTGSATSYNTSSDYRLKENVNYTFDATSRLKQLKPARFNFIADADTTVDGFIAHEVSDIVPEAITGTKDAVDEDGNPEYQGIDQSKLVPLLVKTCQEQQTIIEDLQTRITALENN